MTDNQLDIAAQRRKAIAEALKKGEPVVVSPSGQVEKLDDIPEDTTDMIEVPEGKLA